MMSTGSQLAIERVGGRSVVARARAESPLRLLAPHGGGHAAWVVQSSLGGGFVGEDAVTLRVEVSAGAALLLSSQASSKVYRAARASFALAAIVDDDAALVSWPDPVVCFAGAAFDQTQRFALARTASLVAVDAWTAGRVAYGERWALDRLSTRIAISIDGTPVLDDAMLLTNAHGDLAARLAGQDAFATIVLAGPRLAAICDHIAVDVAARPLGWPLVTASRWPWGLVVRVAAATAEQLARTTRQLVADCTCDLLGVDPCARRY